MTRPIFSLLAVMTFAGFAACDKIPGKPDPSHKWQPPSANLDFAYLYDENCAACHALEPGGLAAARPMDPFYLNYAGADTLRKVTAFGVAGTAMPGFDESVGGPLTTEQVEAIVKGLMAHAAGTKIPGDLPSWEGAPGDPEAGRIAQVTYCAPCHGEDGTGGGGGGSIVDPSFLSLVTDQSLRTSIVAGRPELGMPQYDGLVPGKTPTNQEINDIVAWLSAKRPANAQVLEKINAEKVTE